jgi:Mrp family chromosome partitioning ATPase
MTEAEAGNSARIGPILWREKLVILATVIVVVALAVVYTLNEAKVYQATAILQVNVPTSAPGTSDTTSANQALAQNYASLLTSAGFLNGIKRNVLGGRHSVSYLQSKLNASALPQSALVELKSNGSSPQIAQQTGRQVINGFLSYLQAQAASQTEALQSQLQKRITSYDNQIAALQTQPQTPSVTAQLSTLRTTRTALIGNNATLLANGLANGTSATLSAAPVADNSPISPKKSLNILGGLIIGLALGIALAWARHTLRPAVHSADDVTKLVDLPLLASIPLKPRYKPDDAMLGEAYGVLYANLVFAMRGADARIVTFAGFNPAVGKTSTVEGLGRAASRTDKQVLIVDGDMRAGTLSERLGHRDRPGLVDVLQGVIPLDAALVELESGLWLLPTRPARTNPASLLSGSRTFALMSDLRERFDLVLVDSPPLSGLADGLILASQSDLVALVVRTGVTKPADVTAATRSLRQNQSPVAGVVVFEELPIEPYYAAAAQADVRERERERDRDRERV